MKLVTVTVKLEVEFEAVDRAAAEDRVADALDLFIDELGDDVDHTYTVRSSSDD